VVRREASKDAYRRADQFLIHLDLPRVDPDAIELCGAEYAHD